MKKIALAAAAVALLAGAPALAQDLAGYVGGGFARADAEGVEADGWFVDTAWSGGNVQVDADYVNVEDLESISGALHLFSRNEAYAFGGFVGLSESDVADGSVSVGVEGHRYLESVTLIGAVGYSDSDGEGAYGASAGVRLFGADNLRFDLGAVYLTADDEDVWTLGAGVEYQLDAAPVSVYARYDRADAAGIEVDTALIGVRFNGSASLKERDRSGASFTGLGF